MVGGKWYGRNLEWTKCCCIKWYRENGMDKIIKQLMSPTLTDYILYTAIVIAI